MTEELLVAEAVRHGYGDGDFTLDVDRFDVPAGTVVGLIGPNGAGKSTLVRILAGVLTPRRGAVRLDGRPLAGMERRVAAKRLGYLPQETTSQFDCTVEELVALGRFPHVGGFSPPSATDRAVVDRCIERTELETLRGRPLSHLSGGERKRAFLASTLAQEPAVLLLDEPTASLDLHHQVHFFRLLRELAGKGMAVAVVTHEVNLAALFADRVVLMRDGSVVASGPPREVLTETTVRALYGDDILLHAHPQSGLPVVLPSMSEAEDAP